MPFIKLANIHRCNLPERRPDGKALMIGDVWQCDVKIKEFPGEKAIRCGKIYEWTFDQRDGEYWKNIPVKYS